MPETLASVFAQTYRDFEVFIIDDGSTDGTAAWAAEAGDARVSLLNQPNLGPGAARNLGIARSRGEYLAFLDADDLWMPDKLERQVAYLDAHPEVGLVHTSITVIDERGARLRRNIIAHGHGRLWREIAAYNAYFLVLCGSTPMVRRACFAEVGVFDTTLPLSQDWEMWLRIAGAFEFGTLAAPLVAYRQHRSNISKSYPQMLRCFETVIERAFRHASPQDQPLKAQAYGRTYLHTAWRAFYGGDRTEARKLQGLALRAFPRLLYTRSNLHLALKLAQVL